MTSQRKPELSFWQIWNMCFGFLGIQFGFALQNANVSRIFQTLGANVAEIPILWIAAPLTGLIVQPIIGHYSDRTWTRLGRRRPYFLVGAVLSTLALLVIPNSPLLWFAAVTLWIMDTSFNISMEPFRAFVGDQLPTRQRTLGFAMQTFFIGVGAVVASLLPWLLAHFGVANVAASGSIPDTVKYAFYFGGLVLLGAVLWTVFSSREYPPEQLRAFSENMPITGVDIHAGQALRTGGLWLLAGAILIGLIAWFNLRKEMYLLAAGLLVYGGALLWLAHQCRKSPNPERKPSMFAQVMGDLYTMPEAMRRLAWVQFFSWFALFAMWIYTTPAVTQMQFGTTDVHSLIYNQGANWVGVLFATYNGVAAVAAAIIPLLARRLGLRWTHLINVWLGGLGLLSILLIRNPHWLLLSMIGVGFAWASILSLPYALLSDNLPTEKMGVYMGIFNFFIVIPQLLAASVLGMLLKVFFHSQPIFALLLGAISLFLAGLFVLRVAEPQAKEAS